MPSRPASLRAALQPGIGHRALHRHLRFWVDPVKEMSGIFMVQYLPFAFVSVGEGFWSLVCQALID